MGPIGIFGSGGLAPSGADSLLLAHVGSSLICPLRAAYGSEEEEAENMAASRVIEPEPSSA